MQKVRIFLALGIFITILPYLGFPYFWKDNLSTLVGLVLIYLSYLLYKECKEKNQAKTFDNFRENSDFDGEKIIIETMEEQEKPEKLN